MPDRNAEYYLKILSEKTSPKGRRLYPENVITNILGRNQYVGEALGLQHRADKIIVDIGSEMGIRGKFTPQELMLALSQDSLNRLKRLNANGKIFCALAGPGGAGKDTVLENVEDELKISGRNIRIGRIFKNTTRESNRPGAYHFSHSTDEFHDSIGQVVLDKASTSVLEKVFGVSLKSGVLDTADMLRIERRVNTDNKMTEWNPVLKNSSGIVELIYRKNRGWYATKLDEIVKTMDSSDLAFITGNPQNLASILSRVEGSVKNVLPIFLYVMPAYPPQFISAARALLRDGFSQTDIQLLSTTGPRQTDEMEIFSNLLRSKQLKRNRVFVVENDVVISEPGKDVKTQVGNQLSNIFSAHFNR